MSKKKMFAWLLILSIMAAGMGSMTTARAEQTVTSVIEIQDPSAKVWEIQPGTTTHISIPVKTTTEYIYNPKIEITAEDKDAPFSFSKAKLTTEALPDGAYAIQTAGNTYINFDITTKDSAKIKQYPINIAITWTGRVMDKEGDISQDDVTQNLSITAKITKEKEPAQLVMNNIKYDEGSAAIGNNIDVTFEVRNEGEIAALNSYVTFDYGDTNIIPNYANDNIKLGDIKTKTSKEITVPMKILNTATDGVKNIKAEFKYKDSEGTLYTSTKNIHLTVKKTSTQASDDAMLVINSTAANNEVKVGDSFNIKGVVKNVGKKGATNVELSIISGTGVATGIVPNFETQIIQLKNVAANKKTEFNLPLLVTNTAAAGLNEVTVQVSYTDNEGNTKTSTTPFFVTVIKPDEKVENSDVVITNVSQSPASPLVGQKVTLTFDVENRGEKAITGVSVGADELAASGFEPFSSQAYKEIGDIESKGSKTVTMSFKVGQNAAEGLNALTLGCKYTDPKGNKQAVTSTAYILDVINDSNSKPKIIVSDFSVDSEELKAGSTFVFNFTLKNTHATKVAKNIKATISQADNVFSAAQGTNTFYIDRMDPEEEMQNSIELRVKPDVKTGPYELEIKLEYEYDNMSKTDQEAGGVTESNKLKLQAFENIRTAIQNVAVGMDGEMPYVDQPNTLSFNLINMGKSPLENVSFSLEGDFRFESGDSSYYGTLQNGTPEYQELTVIPTTSGMCSGTIVMSFENSNGEVEEYRQEFSDIMVGEMMDQGEFMGGDMGDPGMPGFNPEEVPETKKDIMPVWAFVLIQVAILAIFIPVVRIIIINIYKKKHQDDEKEL